MTKGLEVCGSACIGVWGSVESWGRDRQEGVYMVTSKHLYVEQGGERKRTKSIK